MLLEATGSLFADVFVQLLRGLQDACGADFIHAHLPLSDQGIELIRDAAGADEQHPGIKGQRCFPDGVTGADERLHHII